MNNLQKFTDIRQVELPDINFFKYLTDTLKLIYVPNVSYAHLALAIQIFDGTQTDQILLITVKMT